MAWGVLESKGGLEHVPGTAHLEDLLPETTTHVKHAGGKDNDVLLIPQPSSNPNDPLNWPLWQRDLILLVYCFCTNICVGGIGPLLSVMIVPLALEFNAGFTKVTLLSGYQLATVGAVALIVSALACKFGKRPAFLVSMVLLLVGSIVCGEAASYNILLGGRIIQGVGTATFESITFAIVGDLYFVHQRGSRMAIYVISQTGLVLLPSLIAGPVAENLGWRWAFRILSISLAVGLLAVIVLGWETSFNRNAVYNIDISSHDNLEIIENLKAGDATHVEGSNPLEKAITTVSSNNVTTRDSFLKRMKPWSTIYTNDSLFKLIVRPVYVLANPVILWAVLIISFSQLWNVFISFTLAQIFSPPPYGLGPAQLGYISVGPMIAGVIGCFACGAVSDPICRYMAKHNNGIYEPEYRLILMIFTPVFAGVGYFLFGNMAEQGKSPVAMSVIWGVIFISVQIVGNATGAYLVDAFRGTSVEIFIISMSVKNFFFFGFSFFMNDWVAEWGPARVFNCIGGVMLGLSITTIPVYIYGKRMRAWWHTHDILSKI